MAKPRKTLQAKIRSLEENVTFWKAQADAERRQRLEKIDSYDQKLKECEKRKEDAEEKAMAFKKIMTDFPRAWDVCKNAAPKESHHEECCWRTHGLLCDCVGEKTFIYCIDTFVEPYKCIASLVEAQAKRIEELTDKLKTAEEALEEEGQFPCSGCEDGFECRSKAKEALKSIRSSHSES